jgi:Ca2+-binding RTX toxin-like protein
LLLGEGGADFIEGGDGADTLDGGAGADTLFGGSGQDLFVYAQHSLSGIDVIADFQPGEDKISLKAIDADTTKVGDQDFDFLGTAVFFGTFPGVRFWHDDHATNVELTIVGEAQPTSLLRLLGHHTLSASDFV